MLDFKKLKQQVSLERVLNHYEILDNLTQRGKSLRGNCPFCEDSEKYPFSVSLEKNAFQCFACKVSGNIFDFVALAEHIDISKGLRKAAEFVDQTFLSKQKIQPEQKKEVEQNISGNDDQEGSVNLPLTFALKGADPTHHFTEDLGISEKTATDFGSGFYSGRGMFKNHFVIPISNPGGELIGYNGIIKGNSIPVYPPKFVKEIDLFKLITAKDNLSQNDYGLTVVRDPLQVLVLADAGFTNAVAYMCDVLSKEQLRQLLRVYDAGSKITLLCASDDHHTPENLTQLIQCFYVRLVRFDRKERTPAGFACDEISDLLALLHILLIVNTDSGAT